MVDDATREYVTDKTAAVESRIKLWVIGGVCANLIPAVAGAYFLGGINQNFNAAMVKVNDQQAQSVVDRAWKMRVQQQQFALEQWAKSRGYAPPAINSEGGM